MNTMMRWMLVSVMLMVAAPAFSAQATQVFSCELNDGSTEEDVRATASEWLKAAKKMEGGDGLEVYLYFPIAVDKTGEIDFLFVIVAPSFQEWGVFWDGYEGSPAAKVDQRSEEHGVCPDSALWETEKVK